MLLAQGGSNHLKCTSEEEVVALVKGADGIVLGSRPLGCDEMFTGRSSGEKPRISGNYTGSFQLSGDQDRDYF